MSVEHMKTWRVGTVEITRIVEVWAWEDDIWMVLEGADASTVLSQPWLQPYYATPQGKMLMNFQAFVIKAGNRRIMIDTCVHAALDAPSRFRTSNKIEAVPFRKATILKGKRAS